jgi:hypothetical protein
MSASDLKSGSTNPNLLSASQATTLPDVAACPPVNHKYEIEPEALELLREFFLLLDQWDQQRKG